MGVPQMKIVIFVDLFYILCGNTSHRTTNFSNCTICFLPKCLYSLSVPLTLRRWQSAHLSTTSPFLRGYVAFSPVKSMTIGRKASHPILCHTFRCYSWPPSIITWGKPSHSLFQDPFRHARPILHGIKLTITFINRLVYYWDSPQKCASMNRNVLSL